jgi:hypothetical protein
MNYRVVRLALFSAANSVRLLGIGKQNLIRFCQRIPRSSRQNSLNDPDQVPKARFCVVFLESSVRSSFGNLS